MQASVSESLSVHTSPRAECSPSKRRRVSAQQETPRLVDAQTQTDPEPSSTFSLVEYTRANPFPVNVTFDKQLRSLYGDNDACARRTTAFNTWLREEWWHPVTASSRILSSIRRHYKPPIADADSQFIHYPVLKAVLRYLGTRARFASSIQLAHSLSNAGDHPEAVLRVLEQQGVRSTEDALAVLLAIFYHVPSPESPPKFLHLLKHSIPVRSPPPLSAPRR